MKVIEKRTRVRSYEKLCELLEVESKTNAEERKKQLDRLRQFYIIVKDKNGNGYSVQSRKEPKPDKPVDKTRNVKYSRLMNSLVMNYLIDGYEPKPMGLILLDIFDKIKFIDYKDFIKNNYGKWLYKLADDAINGKIYGLLDNSLDSLSRNGNIIVNKTFELKNGVLYQDSYDIVKKMTDEMLKEYGFKNEFVLQRSSRGLQRAFYINRNKRLLDKYGFEVKKKVVDIYIINTFNFNKLNNVQYKEICTEIFDLIKIDLIEKLDKDIEKIYSQKSEEEDCIDLNELFEDFNDVNNQMTNESIELMKIIEDEKMLCIYQYNKLVDIYKLKEIFNEYIKYSA